MSPHFRTFIFARVFALAALVLAGTTALRAGNLTRGGSSSPAASQGVGGVSQTSTAATDATTSAAQTAAMQQRAALSLQRTMQATAVLQAQAAAQSAARGLTFSTSSANNLGTSVQPLPNVPDGLAPNGLVPGQVGVDPADPSTVAVNVPVTTNAGGTASVTLDANSALTLPPGATSASQITVSGTGTVGTITTGGTITPLLAGVSTTVPAGSTISLTSGGTVTFAAGSSIPATVSTYAYTNAGATVPVPSSWTGVGGLSQATYAGSGTGSTTVTITQTQQQALLTWQSFNVGKNTTLDFDQSQGAANVGNWVAINKVAANIAPSQILGAIQGPGQVYVLNQNGILFGGSSQVNLGALVASSLPINDNLVADGFLNNPDYQFLFSQLDIPTGSQGTPQFTPEENDPAPGANGSNGGLVSHVDAQGHVSVLSASGLDGDVVVEAGAKISSLSNAQNVGGRVALVGPNVANAGTISTPNGQTILAAGEQVGFVAHNANDPTLRGLDTYIGAISDPSVASPAYSTGTASNTGLIGTLDSSGQAVATPGADVMMAGGTVDQLGAIDLSTSVTLNSRVDLLADYGSEAFIQNVNGFSGASGLYPSLTGPVLLGAGSLTSLTPDLSGNATVVGTQLALSSIVNIQGSTIEMGADSLLTATSASNVLPASGTSAASSAQGISGIDLNAGVDLDAGSWSQSGGLIFSNVSGSVSLDNGAIIDASGSENVNASVAEDIVAVQLLGAQLANSPLQQDGALRGQTVYVDLRNVGTYDGSAWIGTPLADASGYVNLVQRSIGELTTAGGSVAINAGGSVNLAQNSTVDVSGGWINYQGATVNVTNVISNGQLINIAQATPNLLYSGVNIGLTITDSKYGVTQTYTNPLINGTQYDPGFVQGGSGGSLDISGSSVTLGGSLLGNTIEGAYQRAPASTYDRASSVFSGAGYLPTLLSTLTVPTASSFSLTLGQQASPGSFEDPTTPVNVDFGTAINPVDVVIPADLTTTDGFGAVTVVDPTGNVTVPANTPLALEPGGSLSLTGLNVDIESNITAPGGSISLTADLVSPDDGPSSLVPPPPTADSPAGAVSATGNFTLGSGVSLEVGGLIVNDFNGTGESLSKITTGGSVSIRGFSVFLDPGSQVDASGGVYVSGSNAISYGNGGSISVLAGVDPNIGYLVGGQLVLGSELTAYSGAIGGGGSLTLQAPLIQIGGARANGLQNGDLDTDIVREQGGVYGNGNTLWIDPTGTGDADFFSQGGFEKFTANGIGEKAFDSSGNQFPDTATGGLAFDPAILIAPGTTIDPVVQSLLLTSAGTLVPLSTGAELNLLPSQRSPVSFSFNGNGALFTNDNLPPENPIQGNIVVGLGSLIETDPQDISRSGGVSLGASVGTIEVLGDIIAPGGTISISGASDGAKIFLSSDIGAVPTVEIGSESLLSTAGVSEQTFNAQGYDTGTVLNGGAITVKGNIVADTGAELDVSGVSGTFSFLPAQVEINPTLSLSAPIRITTTEDSNGGSITLAGAEELFSNATLVGRSGGASAQGGTLTVYSGELSSLQTPLSATLVVTQDGATFVEPGDGSSLIGQAVTPTNPVTDVDGNPIEAYFAVDPNLFSSAPVDAGNGGVAGGFQNLALDRTVEFSGQVTISTGGQISVAQLASSADENTGGVIYATGAIVLEAPEVSLGLAFSAPSTPPASEEQSLFPGTIFNPSSGSGSLTVNAADLTEVGDLSLQNIGAVNFNTTLANTAASVSGGSAIPVTGNGSILSTVAGTITSANGTVTALQAGVATPVTAGSSITLNAGGTITPSLSGIVPSRVAGDIVGNGTFDVQGTVAMTAAQVYAPTETFFSVFDYDLSAGDSFVEFTKPLQSDSLPSLPLSAGATINIYASNIVQDGVLRAPDGTINLGTGVASATPVDYFTGTGLPSGSVGALSVPTTIGVVLGSNSVTSVSLVDPNTGEGIEVPYGIVNDSGDWIDPAGNDITTAGNGYRGLPEKSINIAGQTVNVDTGSTLDLRGGGNLFAYDFVSGTGGTNDILGSDTSFAVVPGYTSVYAPYAAYAASSGLETNGEPDAGYINSTISLGEQIYLNGGSGLPAGVYTILPARYALMPGAYLVSPSGTTVTNGAETQADGTTYLTGYEFNGLSNSTMNPPIFSGYEIQSQATVLASADYEMSDANGFFPQASTSNNLAIPRLPEDAGQLVLQAGSLSLPSSAGSLLDTAGAGGLGGEVDIASSGAINIYNSADPSSFNSSVGVLNLDSADLTNFNAASLLIGGYRVSGGANTTLASTGSAIAIPSSGGTITFPSGTPGTDKITVSGTGIVGTYTSPDGSTTSVTGGTATAIPAGSVLTLASGGTVTFIAGTGGGIPVTVGVSGTGVSVTTSQLTVNNAGTTLSGSDIILVSNQNLVVDAGSSITATSGTSGSSQPLTLLGDGTLLRVSGDPSAAISRVSVHATTATDPANLQILSSANETTTVSGGASGSIIIDSTNQTSVANSNVNLGGASVALDSGQITIELTTPGVAPTTTGLVLSGQELANLQTDATSLSLLSYSSIDLYNGDQTTPGVIGGAAGGGTFPIQELTLHATDIRGTGGGDVVINAQTVNLDNSSGGTALGAMSGSTPSGTLTINAQTITLGQNTLEVDQFANVDLHATGQVAVAGVGIQGSSDTTAAATVPTASGFAVTGNLVIDTPVLTGLSTGTVTGTGFTSFVDEAITAQGAVTLTDSSSAAVSAPTSGLGAELKITGTSVDDETNIVLHSGSVALTANGTAAGSDVTIGSAGSIDVSGVEQDFVSLPKFTNGGSVMLTSNSGNVGIIGAVDVSAASGVGVLDSVAGNAGSVAINADDGTLTLGGTITGAAGIVTDASGNVFSEGNGGTFALDVGSLAAGNLDSIESVINPVATGSVAGDSYAGGFTQEQDFRVRNGSLTIDGTIAAATVNIATDNGYIAVTGTGRIVATAAQGGVIDTTTTTETQNGQSVTTLKNPGATGGSITLAAGVTTPGTVDSTTGNTLGSVLLESGAFLSAAGQYFSDAGKGGAVTLQAGSDVNGSAAATTSSRGGNGQFGSGVAVADVESGATVDLSVQYLPIELNTSGTSSVTLAAPGAIYFPQGTPGNDELTISGSGNVGQLVTSSGTNTPLTAGVAFAVPAGAKVEISQSGAVISFAAGGSGGAVALNLPATANFTTVGASSPSGEAALTAANQGDLSGTLTLQAPQTEAHNDVQVDPIDGNVVGASSIVVAGLFVQNANTTTTASLSNTTGTAGTATGTNYESVALQNATTFTATSNYNAMAAALVGGDSNGVSGLLNIEPAEEIDNTKGGLGLNSTWDFSQDRYGPNGAEPGILILRAEGGINIAFGASINDGFDTSHDEISGAAYTAPVMSGLSWSYNFVAGADFASANLDQVDGTGSFIFGLGAGALPTTTQTTTKAVLITDGFYQSIRTGTGSITIDAGGNVQLNNELATIYTGGTVAPGVTGFDEPFLSTSAIEGAAYQPQYTFDGGSIAITAGGNIGHYTSTGTADSNKELPTSWLFRQGTLNGGVFGTNLANSSIIESTSWWIDYANFFDGIATFGGGNVMLSAGGNVTNIDASSATNARMPGADSNGNAIAPNEASLVELGGGDVTIQAGNDIDAGVYYVEKGQGSLSAGNEITTNSTRSTLRVTQNALTDPLAWLPTTLFGGDADFTVSSNGNALFGPVANPFLLPQNTGNGTGLKSYFSTYSTSDTVDVSSLTGDLEIKVDSDQLDGSLMEYYQDVFFATNGQSYGTTSQPWLRVSETGVSGVFDSVTYLLPSTLRATAYTEDIDVVGTVLLSPSPTGTVDLAAAGSVDGMQPNAILASVNEWGTATINLSDANPAMIPGPATPLSSQSPSSNTAIEGVFDALFLETGATAGVSLQQQEDLHADINGQPLHADDPNPVYIYASNGDISGLTLYAGKPSDIVAGTDIEDIALYLQNVNASQISIVDAGRNIVAYDPGSILRSEAQLSGNQLLGVSDLSPLGSGAGAPEAGDIQIGGPGTLEVLAGGNVTLGDGPSNTSLPDGQSNGTDTGFTSIGNLRNPTFSANEPGAGIIVGSGLGGVANGLAGATSSHMNFAAFETEFLDPDTAASDPGNVQSDRYLPDLATLMGLPSSDTPQQVWAAFNSASLSDGQRRDLALQVYYLVLRDAGRDHNDGSTAPGSATYQAAKDAIADLFPQPSAGDINLSAREIKTESGGDISLFAPNGSVVVGVNLSAQPVDQGVLTDQGGNINIYVEDNVAVGTSRIFTLDSGNIIIYSADGNIAAGSSSKTVQSAPPTRVLVDSQSAAVETDLAGLATGGGIGVLESQVGAQAADVDLIAPNGIVDAGDAGIRVSGNLNIAAVQVLNASNISVGGKSAGVPTVTTPNLAGLAAASSATGAANNSASDLAKQQQQQQGGSDSDTPSIISVEVIGYGGA